MRTMKKLGVLVSAGIMVVAVNAYAANSVRIAGLSGTECIDMSGDQNVEMYGGANCVVELDLGPCRNIPNGGPPNDPLCECVYTHVDSVSGDCSGVTVFYL